MSEADVFMVGQRAAGLIAESIDTLGLTWADVLSACESCCAVILVNAVLQAARPEDRADHAHTARRLLATMSRNTLSIAVGALGQLAQGDRSIPDETEGQGHA